MMDGKPGDGQVEVTRPERLAAAPDQRHDRADAAFRNEDGGVRPARDLRSGTLANEIFEPGPRDDDGGRARGLAISGHVPRAVGVNQTAQFLEIAAGCSRGSAPPEAERAEVHELDPLYRRYWEGDYSVGAGSLGT